MKNVVKSQLVPAQIVLNYDFDTFLPSESTIIYLESSTVKI